MFLVKPLQKLGLTEKEAAVYLATLELGNASVQEIATKAGMKRPTTYLIIEELQHKGLLAEEKRGRGSTYSAVNPEVLRQRAQEQKRVVEESLPFLTAMWTGEKSKPQVRVYEGVEGMKQIYRETLWKSKTPVWFFSSVKKIYQVFPDILEQWLVHLAEFPKQVVPSREIINPDPVDIEYGLRAIKQNPNEQIRVLPKDFSSQFLATDNAILDDKIVMASLEGKLFTTVIQSQPLVDTMRTLYELAWQSAVPIQAFIQQHPELA